MEQRVKPYANKLSQELGLPVHHIHQWPRWSTGMTVEENRLWVKSLKEQGYTVYDIGTDPGLGLILDRIIVWKSLNYLTDRLINMNSNEVLKDLKLAFNFLKELNFKSSGEENFPDNVSIGFKGNQYNILLHYEYMAENFDFVMIDNTDPARHIQFWRLIERFSETKVLYSDIKPTMKEYKPQLDRIASEIKKVLPVILSLDKNEVLK